MILSLYLYSRALSSIKLLLPSPYLVPLLGAAPRFPLGTNYPSPIAGRLGRNVYQGSLMPCLTNGPRPKFGQPDFLSLEIKS